MFNIIIEFTTGAVIQGTIDKTIWFDYLYETLENDESVTHYTVETI